MSKLSAVLNRLMTQIDYESRIADIPGEVIRTELARKLIFYEEPPYLWPGGTEDPRTTKVNPELKKNLDDIPPSNLDPVRTPMSCSYYLKEEDKDGGTK